MSDRRFRVGVQAHQALDGPAWTAQAQRAEELGDSTLLAMDHFGQQLGPIPAMTAAAEATSELRVGSLVFDNDDRHRVTLAKDIAAVDLRLRRSDRVRPRRRLDIVVGWIQSQLQEHIDG